MTWEIWKPIIYQVLVLILGTALGTGGTLGVQALKSPEAPKPQAEAKLSPALEMASLRTQLAAIEQGTASVLSELRVLSRDMERWRRPPAPKAVATDARPGG